MALNSMLKIYISGYPADAEYIDTARPGFFSTGGWYSIVEKEDDERTSAEGSTPWNDIVGGRDSSGTVWSTGWVAQGSDCKRGSRRQAVESPGSAGSHRDTNSSE